MRSTLLPEANSFRIRWSVCKRLDVVKREERNPNWEEDNRELDWKCFNKPELIKDSRVLPVTDVQLMGP